MDTLRRILARTGAMISRAFVVVFVRGSGRRRP
jgi:hypothetical protein